MAFDEGFIIGLIEGERSVFLTGGKKYKHPVISVVNTNSDILSQFEACLSNLGITFARVKHTTIKKDNWKQSYRTDIWNYKNLEKILEIYEKFKINSEKAKKLRMLLDSQISYKKTRENEEIILRRLNELGGTGSFSVIAETISLSPVQIRKHLKNMVDEGKIKNPFRGIYTVVA